MSLAAPLVALAPTLVVASTLVLVAGLVAMASSRSLIQCKRFATTTLLVFLAWVALALLPIPRPLAAMGMAPGGSDEPTLAVAPAVPTLPVAEAPSAAAAPRSSRMPQAEPGGLSSNGMTTSGFALEVLVWLMASGSLLAASYLVLAWFVLRRRVARAEVAPSHVLELARELSSGIARLRVLVTEEPTRPFCFGLRTPTIVLSRSLCGRSRRQRLRAVLLHELGHVTGKDLRDQVLLAVCLPLLYWHPLFWVLRQRLRLTAELVADDLATQRVDRKTYVRALIDLVEQPARSLPLAPALPVRGPESEFYRRMNMLLNRERPLSTRCSAVHTLLRRGAASLILTGLTLGLGLPALPAQNAMGVGKPGGEVALGTYTYRISGSYPSAGSLENMLLLFGRSGFSTTGLRVAQQGDSKRRSLDVELSVQVDTQEKARALVAKWRTLQRELRQLDIRIKRWAPGRVRVDVAKKQAAVKRVSVAVADEDIHKVIASIARAAGVKVVVASDVKGTVTLKLQDIPWRDALDVACLTFGNVEIQEDGQALRVLSARGQADKAPRVYFAFEDTSIAKVIDTIARISGSNIVVSPEVNGNITMRLRNIPWRDALEAACKTLGYVVVQEDRGILHVVAPKKLR